MPTTLAQNENLKDVDYKNPSLTILMKLGSLAVHIEEYFSPKGHPLDKSAIEAILADKELREFLEAMSKDGLLPVKR